MANRKSLYLLDPTPPSKASSPNTPEFSPAFSASSGTTSVADLTSSFSIVADIEKEGVDVSMEPLRFIGLKFGSIEEELLTLPDDYEPIKSMDLNAGVVERLKEARSQVLKSDYLDLSSKKLLDELIEVIIAEELSGFSEKIDCSDIKSTKHSYIILLLLLLITVTCAVFFSSCSSRNSFNGPLPT